MTPIKSLVVVCTSAKGGMRSVVDGHGESGLLARWNAVQLWSHCEGGAAAKLGTALKAYILFVGLLLRGKVSVLHLHASMRGSFWRKSLFLAFAKIFGIPTILHLHGSETVLFFSRLPILLRRLAAHIIASADAVIVLSPSWKRFVSDFSPIAKAVVVSNYVKVPSAMPSQQRPPNEILRLVFMGAVGKRKGIYQLIEAFAQAQTRCVQELRLYVGGDGELVEAKALAANLGVAHQIDFLGWVSTDTREALLSQADLYVLPSFNEGLPMSVLEAMAAGVAVVTTRVGGIPDLLTHQVDGWLVDAGDVDALATAITEMANAPAMRASIASRGFQRVSDQFSEEVNVPKLNAIYSALTNGSVQR